MQDLRTFLEQVEKAAPGNLLTIDKPIDPELEATTLLWNLECDNLAPITLFENPLNMKKQPCGFKLISNVYATREKLAIALKLPPQQYRMETSLAYQMRRDAPIAPIVIARDEAPVKENVWTGKNADLHELPIVTHHEMDAGAYMTMPVIGADPDTGVHNVSFQRMWIKGPQDSGISIAPRHLWNIYQRYEKQGRGMPIAVVLGHHPTIGMAAMASIPIDKSEYDVCGGLMEEPLRLVESETWGKELLVPADSEIIVEGEVIPNVRLAEAPFGEFTGYYGSQKLNPVVKIHAITFRNEPILQTVFIGHPDSDYVIGLSIEGDTYAAIKAIIPTIRAVHCPSSGKTFNLHISMTKPYEGAPKAAAMVAIPQHDFIKHVFVVDDDIDVFDERQVMWAFATRVQGDEDIEIIKGVRGNVLDPSAKRSPVTTNVIIDATKPLDRPFELALSFPEELTKRMTPDEYIPAKTLESLKRGL